MVNPKFVINAMREMDLRYFAIEDQSGNVMYHQWQTLSLEKSIERLENFIKNCSTNSSFVVYLYKSNERLKNGEPTAKNQGMRYEVWVDEPFENDRNMGIRGMDNQQNNQYGSQFGNLTGIAESMYRVGSMGSVGLETYLGTKDEIMSLKLKIQQLEMENRYLEDKYAKEIESIKKDYEDKLSSDKKIEGIIGSVLPAMGFGGGMAGIMGLTQNAQMEKEKTTKEKVIDAINILLESDPDFVDNITKLAQLSQSNPTIYKVAVQQLNKL
jgi:hypothetical protein